eukprot:1823244-Rhodomonas_salina.1
MVLSFTPVGGKDNILLDGGTGTTTTARATSSGHGGTVSTIDVLVRMGVVESVRDLSSCGLRHVSSIKHSLQQRQSSTRAGPLKKIVRSEP